MHNCVQRSFSSAGCLGTHTHGFFLNIGTLKAKWCASVVFLKQRYTSYIICIVIGKSANFETLFLTIYETYSFIFL